MLRFASQTWISQVTGVNWQRVSLESCDVGIDLNVLLRETQLRVVAPNIRPPNLDLLQVLHYLKTFPHAFIDLLRYLKLLGLIGSE